MASGEVLQSEQATRPWYPASTTKLMTAYVALKEIQRGNVKFETPLVVSPHAAKQPPSKIGLKAGQEITVENALKILMVKSANDVSTVVAEGLGGSVAGFSAMMNREAARLGMRESHFVNPHGLHAKGHYSSAYDLALIARYATSIPEFNEIVATKHKRIDRSISKLDVTLRNTGRLLWRFDGADGIKTGYTKEAGHCFVGAATRNGWRLVSVVLKSGNTMDDTIALLDHGFKNYKLVCFARKGQVAAKLPVRGGVEPSVDLIAVDNLGKIVRIDLVLPQLVRDAEPLQQPDGVCPGSHGSPQAGVRP